MSNPVMAIGNNISVPSGFLPGRTTYSLIQFDNIPFKIYETGESSTGFESQAINIGESFIMARNLDDAINKPDFITQGSWDNTVKKMPSIFLSPAMNSLMPKLMVPSAILVDNGSLDLTAMKAFYNGTSDLFNWSLNADIPTPYSDKEDASKRISVALGTPKYISTIKKDDTVAINQEILYLSNPSSAPSGGANKWDASSLVVGGAFCLMLNITPMKSGKADPNDVADNKWGITFSFGDVVMQLDQGGGLDVQINGGPHQKADLADGKAKQGPPQQEVITESTLYIITVYPVWNGIVVSSGLADSEASIGSTSQYIQAVRGASIKKTSAGWFDVTHPGDIKVDFAGYEVNFGDNINILVENCYVNLAYLPAFFTKYSYFDHWLTVNNNVGGANYVYNFFKIYTLNKTGYTVSENKTVLSGGSDSTVYLHDDWAIQAGNTDPYLRFAPQVFASIMQTTETHSSFTNNGNGNFVLSWSGGSPADTGHSNTSSSTLTTTAIANVTIPITGSTVVIKTLNQLPGSIVGKNVLISDGTNHFHANITAFGLSTTTVRALGTSGDTAAGGIIAHGTSVVTIDISSDGRSTYDNWQDYVISANFTLTIDSMSGQVVVDAYGLAGQKAIPYQNVGAFTAYLSGGFGTLAGNAFSGIAMGIQENRSKDGSNWTIPLVGLDKKLDDMCLINVPLMDGYLATTALTYLFNYAGIKISTAKTSSMASMYLGVSEDLNVPRFDWRTGTPVRTAIDDVCKDLGLMYVIYDDYGDGTNCTAYIYVQDETTCLPIVIGANEWGNYYSSYKIEVMDKQPDFTDIRNEIVVIGLTGESTGQNTDYANPPLMPLILAQEIATTPIIPWARSNVEGMPGFANMAKLTTFLNKQRLRVGKYMIAGKISLPGNAQIKPLDTWTDSEDGRTYFIGSVSHNVDFQSKTWKTDLELFYTSPNSVFG